MAKKSKVTVKFNSKAVGHTLASVAVQRMYVATNVVRSRTLEKLSGPRAGREYRVPGTNVTYTASAPGEPPAVRLGELRQSVNVSVKTEGPAVIGEVGTPLDHGLYMEHGTVRILPRRWLGPSFEESLKKVKEILSRRWM
jgi:hypothetical protein